MAGDTGIELEPRTRGLLQGLARFFSSYGGAGVEAYASGGFLRDALLGIAAHDIDLTIAADPLEAGPALADALGGHYFPLDEEMRLARVLVPEQRMYVDLQPIHGSIEEDLLRRDYTIDALAAPLAATADGRPDVIDPTGGLSDLRAGIVRMVSETAFHHDPLRALRGPRIATHLGFAIEAETADAIRRHAPEVTTAAPERQRDELMRIFATERAGQGMRLLDDLGLLDVVLPEMQVTRGVMQPKEHHWDVLGHHFGALEYMDALVLGREPEESPYRDVWRELWSQLSWWEEAREYFEEEIVFGTKRMAVLKLCTFLHDIGKPATKSVQEDGRVRFFGHSEVGARMAEGLMRRLRFSAREIRMVAAMIEAHLRPVQMAQQGPPTKRAVYRFFRDTGEAGIDTLVLSLADHLGTVGPRPNMDGFRQHVAVVSHIIQVRFRDEKVVSPPKLLRGDELMAALGIPPGPLVGELLETVREAQAAGEVSTREQALELARAKAEEARDAVAEGGA